MFFFVVKGGIHVNLTFIVLSNTKWGFLPYANLKCIVLLYWVYDGRLLKT